MSSFSSKPERPAYPAGPQQNIRGAQFIGLVLRVPAPDCACEGARQNANKTFGANHVPELPLRDCGLANCRCSYERVANRRRGERRAKADRRDEIRFEMKGDRRSHKDRRKTNDVWNESH